MSAIILEIAVSMWTNCVSARLGARGCVHFDFSRCVCVSTPRRVRQQLNLQRKGNQECAASWHHYLRLSSCVCTMFGCVFGKRGHFMFVCTCMCVCLLLGAREARCDVPAHWWTVTVPAKAPCPSPLPLHLLPVTPLIPSGHRMPRLPLASLSTILIVLRMTDWWTSGVWLQQSRGHTFSQLALSLFAIVLSFCFYLCCPQCYSSAISSFVIFSMRFFFLLLFFLSSLLFYRLVRLPPPPPTPTLSCAKSL